MHVGVVVRIGAGIAAAAAFFYAGQQMNIQSVAGDTINEAFYQAMGIFSYGMSALSIAVVAPAFTFKSASAENPLPPSPAET